MKYGELIGYITGTVHAHNGSFAVLPKLNPKHSFRYSQGHYL